MKYTTLNYEGYEQYLIAESFDHFGVEALMYTFEFDNENAIVVNFKNKKQEG